MPCPPGSAPSGPGPDAGTHSAVCGHTHLFPGARVRVRDLPDPAAHAAAPRPLALVLDFSDGASATAELLVSPTGEAALRVGAYTTHAGTRLPERTWLVHALAAVEGDVELAVGTRLD